MPKQILGPYVTVTGVALRNSEVGIERFIILTAVIEPAQATNKAVTWSSSDKNIAVVDNNGRVTGIALGTATITVTTEEGGFTAACEVAVVERADFIVYSTTPDSAFINLITETIHLPDGFTVAAYSATTGGTRWRKGVLPNAAKFPSLLNKGLILHVTNNFDQSKKKPAADAQVITFPRIAARPKRNAERLVPFYGDSHWALAKRNTTTAVFADYEYAPSANGKTPEGGVWLQIPEEGIPIASGSARQSFLVRAAPNDNPTAASVPWRVRPVNFGKAPTLSIQQAKVNGSADKVAVIAFKKGDQYAIGDGDFTAALTVKTTIPVSQLSAQGTELRIRRAATGKRPPSEVQRITLPTG